MTNVRLLALMYLTVAAATAQDRGSHRISSETTHASTIDDRGRALPADPPASLPDAPGLHRVLDKKFIFVMAGLGGAETLRFTSRKLVLDHELAAGAPWVTHVPANQHLVARDAGLYAAEWAVAYEVKKPHSWLPGDHVIRKFWWAYPAAMAAIHLKNGIGNIRTQGLGERPALESARRTR